MPDNRNFMLAIALSLAVLIGWTFFVSGPQIDQARQQELTAQQQAATEQQPSPAADGVAIPQADGTF